MFAVSVLITSVFNASRGSVGLAMLFHLASNAAFVFLPLLPENRDGDLTTFSIFVALAVVLAAVVVRINGPGSLASSNPIDTRDRKPVEETQGRKPVEPRPDVPPAGPSRLEGGH